MTAISNAIAPPVMRSFQIPEGSYARQPRGASVTLFPGGLLIQREGSDLVEHPSPTAPQATARCLGVLVSTDAYVTGASVDSAGGAVDTNGLPNSITVQTGFVGWFDTGTSANKITNADVDSLCYLYDNNTLYRTALSGTLPVAGQVASVRADGKIKLKIDPVNTLAALNRNILLSRGQTAVRNVVTALSASTTYAAGVLTGPANTAFGAQDGVTNIVGDMVFIQKGTTNLPGAANAGPWQITALGSGTSQYVLTRPSWHKTGNPVFTAILYQPVEVGPEGTLYGPSSWKSFAAPTAIIDTTDPLFWPRRLSVTLTMSGTAGLSAAVTTIPIRAVSGNNASSFTFSPITVQTDTSGTSFRTSALTPGALGTATFKVVCESVFGTVVAADTTIGVAEWTNW